MQGQLHENACYFANFARCAGEQAKFWEVAEIIYESKEHTGNVRQSISEAVSSLGLDMQALHECVDNGRQLEVIKKDIERAIELDIQGTPTIWVNGKKFEGRTERDFRQLFDFILKK
jgi:protein-disulfide isomerase